MDQLRKVDGLIGKGLYSAPDAARLTGIPVRRIGRWLRGGSHRYRTERVVDRPLREPEISEIDGHLFLSFRDLIELRIVDRFRAHGLSLPYIRKVVETETSRTWTGSRPRAAKAAGR